MRRQPGGQVAFNPPLGLVQRGGEAANGLRAAKCLVVTAEGGNLPSGPRRVFDQRREVALRSMSPARFASRRAMLPCSSRCTTSLGTVGTPAASSARLWSSASAQPGGASNDGGVSVMAGE